jgi:hypothetical protein
MDIVYSKKRKSICFEDAVSTLLCLGVTDLRLSVLLYSILKTDFQCRSVITNKWYYKCNKGKWHYDTENIKLRSAITEELCPRLVEEIHEYTQILNYIRKNTKDFDVVRKKMDKIAKMLIWLEEDKNKNKVIRASRDIFYKQMHPLFKKSRLNPIYCLTKNNN